MLCLHRSSTAVLFRATNLVCLIAYVIAITHASCKDTAVSLQALMRTSQPYALCRVSSRYDAPPPVCKCTIAMQVILTCRTHSAHRCKAWLCRGIVSSFIQSALHRFYVRTLRVFLHTFVCCPLTI